MRGLADGVHPKAIPRSKFPLRFTRPEFIRVTKSFQQLTTILVFFWTGDAVLCGLKAQKHSALGTAQGLEHIKKLAPRRGKSI